jgi:hypothetical protein
MGMMQGKSKGRCQWDVLHAEHAERSAISGEGSVRGDMVGLRGGHLSLGHCDAGRLWLSPHAQSSRIKPQPGPLGNPP